MSLIAVNVARRYIYTHVYITVFVSDTFVAIDSLIRPNMPRDYYACWRREENPELNHEHGELS